LGVKAMRANALAMGFLLKTGQGHGLAPDDD